MALIKIVPKEDMQVLEKYCGYPGVVLISEAILSELPAPAQELISDGKEIDYDFGGESDIMADFVLDKDHYFITEQLNKLN